MIEKKCPDDYLFKPGFDSFSFGMCRVAGMAAAAVYSRMRGYFKMRGENGESYGLCFAGQERIAEELGIHRNTVNTAIQALLDHGYIKYMGVHTTGTNIYSWVTADEYGEFLDME